MGGSAAICLEILGLIGVFPAGKDYAVFFGAFYGLMEFIPYIGPIVGPIPAVLVALFQDPITAVWLIILFVALQQLEGHVVAPQVFRISLRINPIVIILALLIGFKLYGIVGALVALPVLAVIRQTVVYLQRHLVLEPWGTRGVGLGAALGRRSGPMSGLRRAGGRRGRLLPLLRRLARAARDHASMTGRNPRQPARGPRGDQALRCPCRRCSRSASSWRRESWSGSSAPTAPGRRRCSRSWPACWPPTRASSRSRGATRAGCPSSPALYSKLSVAENLRLFARLEKAPRSRGRGDADAGPDRPGRPRRRGGRQALGRQPATGQHRHRAALRARAAVARRALGFA